MPTPDLLALGTTLTMMLGLGAATSGEQGPPPAPRPEKVVTTIVKLPAEITSVRFPAYAADGARILAGATSTGFRGTQLVSFAEDGTGLRCLTCQAWNGPELLKPIAFPDGRRVLVRIGAQTPDVPADHGVVECAPSVTDCRRATVVPIVPPAAADPNVEQDQREFRLAPDGQHVALSQVRRTASGRSTAVGIVGRLVRRGDAYHVDDARVVATDGELKGFTRDGQSVTFARFLNAFEAGNPDAVQVDLRSGREGRLTTALDWDEDIDISPHAHGGRGWMVVGSARTTGLLETFTQIRRPPFIDEGVHALPFVAFNTRNPQIAEPWLVDEHDARGSYAGQPLAPDAISQGWDSKPNFRWKPDGTAVMFWQQQMRSTQTRVVITRLPERKPARPSPARATPTPSWAPPLAGHTPPDLTPMTFHRGKISGSITITRRPSPTPPFESLLEVTYTNYSDTPGFVINGIERSHYGRSGLYGTASRYSADLVVSGQHRGFLKADNVLIQPDSITGTITSELDGRRLALGPLP